MMYRFFFVLAMLFALALLGLLGAAVWRVLVGNRLRLLRAESRKGPAELARFLKSAVPAASPVLPAGEADSDRRETIADAADRDRHLAALTAFSRRGTFRAAAFTLLALTGAAGLALTASGFVGKGLVYALDGFVLLLIALLCLAILGLLAQTHDRYLQTLSILVENLEGLEGLEPDAETDEAARAGSSRVIRMELALFAAFLALLVARYFLLAFLRVNVSATLGFAISFGSFVLLCLGFLAAVGALNRKPRRKDGA